MRKKRPLRKTLYSDPKHNNTVVGKFINFIMRDGKKSIAQKVLYDAFDIVAIKTKKDPIEIFDLAIKNVSPQVEVKTRRIGGAHYQVPREVRGDRKITLAFRWLIAGAKNKKGRPMPQRLAEELMDAAKNEGYAVKKREETHKVADANKAFAHFAW